MAFIKEAAKEAKLGPILAMMKLLEVRRNERAALTGNHKDDILLAGSLAEEDEPDVALAAGLPDARVPWGIRIALLRAAVMAMSPYFKYQTDSPLQEDKLKPLIAAWHEKQYNVSIPAEQFGIAAGSTPIIDAVARLSIIEPGKKMLGFGPGYPLTDLSVNLEGGISERSLRLRTKLDLGNDGQPVQTTRWWIDIQSVRESLKENRESATMLFLNFPSNPTGFSPTPDEYKELVAVLIEDVIERKKLGLPCMTILEDMAYVEMMYDKKFYSIFNAIDDMRAENNKKGSEFSDALKELEDSVVCAHSFSKAFSVAGDRVAYYTARNKELFYAVTNVKTINDLTPSRGSLVVMKAAMKIGKVDEKAMDAYGRRLKKFEEGFARIVRNFVEKKNPGEGATFVERFAAVPARADAGFFSTTFLNALNGIEVPPEMVEKLKKQVAKIANPSLRKEFTGMFAGNKVNNSFDANMWLLCKAHVCGVPLELKDGNIVIRFSVGQTDEKVVGEVIKRVEAALLKELGILPSPGAARAA